MLKINPKKTKITVFQKCKKKNVIMFFTEARVFHEARVRGRSLIAKLIYPSQKIW